ncbi:MAG: ABC transporter substrate-binding protein [Methanomicrobium sp.]|nr:ABC transporter substrate-binding protein [Methanomicrobium sp.]
MINNNISYIIMIKTGIILVLVSLVFAAAVVSSGCTGGSAYVYEGDNSSSVTITDTFGREVAIPSEIESIACSSGGACTRLVAYMDAADMLCGIESGENSNSTNRAYVLANPQFVDLPVISSKADGANLEAIMVQNPHVIFMTGSSVTNESGEAVSPADTMQMKTNIPVIGLTSGSFQNEDNRTKMYSSFRVIGKALGKESRAEELISYIDETIEDLIKRTENIPESERKTAYIGGLSHSGAHGMMSTQSEYMPFIWCNIINIAEGTGVQNADLSKEALLYADPDYIFIDAGTLGVTDDINGFQEVRSPAFSSLGAVKSGNVYATLPYTSRSTNYETILVDAYFIGKTVYPEKFADIDPAEKADEIYMMFVGEPVFDELNEICNNQAFEKIPLN